MDEKSIFYAKKRAKKRKPVIFTCFVIYPLVVITIVAIKMQNRQQFLKLLYIFKKA